MWWRYLTFWIACLSLGACSSKTLEFAYTSPADIRAPTAHTFGLADETCTEINWDFGDGETSTERCPTHTYYLSGTYDVALSATCDNKQKLGKKRITVEAPEKCLVKIETSHGVMIAELFETTPLHRDNFIKLAEEGFYDELLFHRVIEGFMIQGGDPGSKGADMMVPLGAGGPGYQVDAEITSQHAHQKGALAAARQGDQVNPARKSSGSQFYIVHGKEVPANQLAQYEARLGIEYPQEVRDGYLNNGGVPFLDQQYTVFGQVIEGLDVIDKIAVVRTNPQDRPTENVTMKISVIK